MMNIVNTPKSISIDFDANEIRIVEGKASKKGITINKHFSIKIPREIYQDGTIKDMEQLSYLLKNGLASNNISKGNVHVVINSSIIIIREVAFPKVNKEDLDNLIEYQLGDFVPIHPEDYVVKYINLGTFLELGVEKLNMLIIGVPKDMAQSHFQLIKDLGLKPAVLDYKGNAIAKLLGYGESINSRVTEGQTLAFLDMSYGATGLTVIKDELIQLSRLIEGGFNNILDNIKDGFALSEEEAFDWMMSINDINESSDEIESDPRIVVARRAIQEIADRVEMVVRYYHTKEMENRVDILVLHGPLTGIKGIEKFFSDYFNVTCVNLQAMDGLKFDGDLSKYGNAIGGLIRVNGV